MLVLWLGRQLQVIVLSGVVCVERLLEVGVAILQERNGQLGAGRS